MMLLSNAIFAQDIKFTASVSKTQVTVGELFEVTFTATGQIQRLNPPSFDGFQVVGGPNQSSSMTSINGVTSISMGLSYDLIPSREGDYTIGSSTAGFSKNGKPNLL